MIKKETNLMFDNYEALKIYCNKLEQLLEKAKPLIIQKFDVSTPWLVNEIEVALKDKK